MTFGNSKNRSIYLTPEDISHFLIVTAKHAGIVWKDSAIERTSHET